MYYWRVYTTLILGKFICRTKSRFSAEQAGFKEGVEAGVSLGIQSGFNLGINHGISFGAEVRFKLLMFQIFANVTCTCTDFLKQNFFQKEKFLKVSINRDISIRF